MTDAGRPATPRFSSTVVLLREDDGLEVLMLRRHAAVEFAGDAWVFPGGAVDEADCALARACWRGIDPASLAGRFATTPDVALGFHVAAVRELFEEAGVLLAAHPDGATPDLAGAGVVALRTALEPGVFHGWLEREGVVLDLSGLTYLSRWVTPVAMPKRFDTAFFVAPAPDDQVAAHDRAEMTDGRWLRPADALVRHAAGALQIMPPTLHTVRWLAAFQDVATVLGVAASQTVVDPVMPRVVSTPDGRRVIEHDDEYPEPPR